MIVDWPAGVPSCFVPMSPQGGLRDNRISFETESRVAPIERPSSTWTPEVYSVEVAPFTVQQFQDFQDWFTGELAFGVNLFRADHPITGVLTVWRIAKADPPYSVRKIRRMPNGSNRRAISVSFTMISSPESAT